MLSGKNGFWTTFDMKDAIEHGQKALGLEFSGEFDYVDSTYAFPITHMVAPKKDALSCSECHCRAGTNQTCLTVLDEFRSLPHLQVYCCMVWDDFLHRNGKEE